MAARMAISSPFGSITNGAKVFLQYYWLDMTMAEVSDASSIIADSADADADIILGRLLMKTWVQKLRLA